MGDVSYPGALSHRSRWKCFRLRRTDWAEVLPPSMISKRNLPSRDTDTPRPRARAVYFVNEQNVRFFGLVRFPARSRGRSSTAPNWFAFLHPAHLQGCGLSRFAQTGGPVNRIWSSASPRFFAASRNSARLAFSFSWPMKSAKLLRPERNIAGFVVCPVARRSRLDRCVCRRFFPYDRQL